MKRLAAASCFLLFGVPAAAMWGARNANVSTGSRSSLVTHDASRTTYGSSQRIYLSESVVRDALSDGVIDRPIKSLLRIQAPLRFGEYVWNDSGIPAGPTWIRVDLRSQLISVFRGGHEIGSAVIVYGASDKATPIGQLRILSKARQHESSIYDASMPYTLRLTNDGISIHASEVRSSTATHGCIGVPTNFAERLFNAAAIGDNVTIQSAKPA